MDVDHDLASGGAPGHTIPEGADRAVATEAQAQELISARFPVSRYCTFLGRPAVAKRESMLRKVIIC
ncbi:hypothetical protein [Streptomyces olivochromogenes]|uniref:hypothetical protein n=1 Tax=Streptomyces olivochromogenes TaxID=1963 RepID=UPI001F39473E|nr:hypothetical protein [Streptomyces olivochromogenes]MCF3130430.1 hypothetical protein [Streptomyces olivochromogenes]